MKTKTTPTINSIIRATDILVTLSDGLSRVTDIASRLNLSPATTYRILKTLEVVGLVIQDTISSRYYFGPLITKLASNRDIVHQVLIIYASNEMKRLWELSGETVTLHILLGTQRICIKELQSNHEFRFVTAKEISGSLYPGVMGKALLSQCGDNELNMILEHMKIAPLTPNTITDKKLLMEELKRVRMQGYATSAGELVLDGLGIAVPILNYTHPVALGIVGPENRLKSNMPVLIEETKESAKRISHNLLRITLGSR